MVFTDFQPKILMSKRRKINSSFKQENLLKVFYS